MKLAIPKDVEKELQAEAKSTGEAMQVLSDLAIQNDDDLAFAGDVLKDAKTRWKALEEKRTAVTGPLNAALREINGWFKPVQEPLKRAESILKEKI